MAERIADPPATTAAAGPGAGKPVRVLMTADTVGGVFTYAVELCRGLAAHDVHVALATMGAPLTREQRAALSGLANVVVCESSYRLEWMDSPWPDVDAAGDWLMQLEDLYAPDVVHLNGYAHGALPWRVPVLVAAHSCVLSWWRAVKGEDAPPAWDDYRRRVAAGLWRADLVVAPTLAMLDALEQQHGRIDHRRVIYNGRDPQQFRSEAKEPLVFSAGRLWDEAKNLAALETCAPRLPWPVYVAGPARPPDGARAADTDPARAPHPAIHPLGALAPEDVAAWLARAAIYALPARYEPFGLSALEAALSGCALALGDIDSLREVWGDAAVFVPPDDPEQLARVISALADDPDRRAQLAERGRRRALHYTAERMTREYLDVYRSLIQGRHGRSNQALASNLQHQPDHIHSVNNLVRM
jgi:glycogen(starch) synthase